jgi:hypothetical protein
MPVKTMIAVIVIVVVNVPIATDTLRQIASLFDHLVGAGQTVAKKKTANAAALPKSDQVF